MIEIMRTSLYLILIIAMTATTLQAQVQNSGWVASFNTLKINDKFSMHFDAQVRSTDELQDFQTVLLRPGINYHLGRNLSLTAGYAYIPNRRFVGGASGLLAEHRIWTQTLYSHKLKRASVNHRLRFEQRFIPNAVARGNKVESDGFRDARRIRYFVRNVLPLAKDRSFNKGFFLALQNEVFANVGDKSAVNGRFFDQNRLYGAVGYRLPNKIDVDIGYMNQYVKNRNSFVNNHIIQLAFYRRL